MIIMTTSNRMRSKRTCCSRLQMARTCLKCAILCRSNASVSCATDCAAARIRLSPESSRLKRPYMASLDLRISRRRLSARLACASANAKNSRDCTPSNPNSRMRNSLAGRSCLRGGFCLPSQKNMSVAIFATSNKPNKPKKRLRFVRLFMIDDLIDCCNRLLIGHGKIMQRR